MSDPRVTAIPVQECGEPLVDCRGTLRVDERRADTAGNWAHLRLGVAERLLRAEELLPDGWRWLLVEGHRPPALQQRIFDGYVATLRNLHPGASNKELSTAATRWVAQGDCRPCGRGGHRSHGVHQGWRRGGHGMPGNGHAGGERGSLLHKSGRASGTATTSSCGDGRGPQCGGHGQLSDGVVALVVRGPLLGPVHRGGSRPLRALRPAPRQCPLTVRRVGLRIPVQLHAQVDVAHGQGTRTKSIRFDHNIRSILQVCFPLPKCFVCAEASSAAHPHLVQQGT